MTIVDRVRAMANGNGGTGTTIKDPFQAMRAVVGLFMLFLFAGVILTLLFRPVKLDDVVGGMLITLIGILAREVSSVGAFYFGTSAGNAGKDQTIANMAERPRVVEEVIAPAKSAPRPDSRGNDLRPPVDRRPPEPVVEQQPPPAAHPVTSTVTQP